MTVVKVGDQKVVQLLVKGTHELQSMSDPIEVTVDVDSYIDVVMEWRKRQCNQSGEWVRAGFVIDSIRPVPPRKADPELVEYYKLPWWKKLFVRKPGIPRMFLLPPSDPDDGFI